MIKFLLATAASLALLSAGGCAAVGKGPVGLGKGKAPPPPVIQPAPRPVITKG